MCKRHFGALGNKPDHRFASAENAAALRRGGAEASGQSKLLLHTAAKAYGRDAGGGGVSGLEPEVRPHFSLHSARKVLQ